MTHVPSLTPADVAAAFDVPLEFVATMPGVQRWATSPPVGMLTRVEERVGAKGQALKAKVTNHPAATFGVRAEEAGFEITYRYARGPIVVKHRPDEPNAKGKLALVSTVEVVDTLAVKLSHPDGRQGWAVWLGEYDPATWWSGVHFGEAWGSTARTSLRSMNKTEITALVAGTLQEDEMTTTEDRRSTVQIEARALIAEGYPMPESVEEHVTQLCHAYETGHQAAAQKAGDSYGEGYAAGLAAVTGRTRVWVAARRALGELKPGDVILGKGDRWWTVSESAPGTDRRWVVNATSGDDQKTIVENAKRKVDVVEPIQVVDALKALTDEEFGARIADGLGGGE